MAIEVERPGVREALPFDIVRENVAIEPASWARVPGSEVAVVRVVQFSAGSGERAREAIRAVLVLGALGIVLDLRGNPGGFVSEALEVVSAFLDTGVAYQEARVADGPPRLVDIPAGQVIAGSTPLMLCVLVD